MDSKLERALRALKEANAGRSLDSIEGAVWRSIDSERARAFVLVPIRGIAVCLALGVGVLIGNATAATRAQGQAEISALSLQPTLAPSTLLGGHE